MNVCSTIVSRNRRKAIRGALKKVLKSRRAARAAWSVSCEFLKYFRYLSFISARILGCMRFVSFLGGFYQHKVVPW